MASRKKTKRLLAFQRLSYKEFANMLMRKNHMPLDFNWRKMGMHFKQWLLFMLVFECFQLQRLQSWQWKACPFLMKHSDYFQRRGIRIWVGNKSCSISEDFKGSFLWKYFVNSLEITRLRNFKITGIFKLLCTEKRT